MKSRWAAGLVLVLILGLLLPEDAGAFVLPPGFSEDTAVDSVGSPTSIDWLPNGDLLITSQEGTLYRAENGTGPAEGVLDLTDTVCSGGETGLLGLAVDPNFDANGFIYLYYTDRQGGGGCGSDNRANRVSRFTVDGSGNINPNSEQVLIDNISARGGNHNGGDLQFDKDGLLYISVGDAGEDLITGEGQNNNRNARLLSLLNGKILRIETDGSIPAGNPFTGNNTRPCADGGGIAAAGQQVSAEKKNRKHKKKNKKKQRRQKRKRRQLRNADTCQEIFATGLRNPFRIAFDPDDTSGQQRFYINDVGGGAWEEIDEGEAGADYGWNVREGPCPTGESNCSFGGGGFEPPIFAYRLSTGCRTITGGAFVPDGSGWPDEYLDTYLYADFSCDTLFALRDEEFGETPEPFGTGTGAVHLRFGPDNNLYYTTFESGGEVRRIIPPP
jgi:glucose/arabinose dehydrogenase